MTVHALDKIPFTQIVDCFNLSFKGYFVKMPTDPEYYKQRWSAAKVNYALSFGMFDNNRLVGFIINAIDKRQGQLTAYNSGTGVIPAYRGKRIVNSIYKAAIPKLQTHGISKCTLEVIKENAKAIKAYETVGMSICKGYKCFGGEISLSNNTDFSLKEVSFNDIVALNNPNEVFYSWDNQLESIQLGAYKYYLVGDIGYFILNPENGYIAQIDVFTSNSENWNIMWSAVNSIADVIKINNVDERLTSKLEAIKSIGLTNTVDQFEMEMSI